MSKKEKDIALFVAFCIEEYGTAKGMNGEQVFDLFSRYGVTDYLSKCFERGWRYHPAGCDRRREQRGRSGSVVTHDVEPNTIVAGNPARVHKRIAYDAFSL